MANMFDEVHDIILLTFRNYDICEHIYSESLE